MGLFLITGIAGSGKTAVVNMLREHRYSAYDIDDDGFAHWVNIDTGESAGNNVNADARTPEFQKQYAWRMYGDKLRSLAKEAESKDIYLGGIVDGMEQYYPLFSAMFYLDLPKDVLAHRLKTRTGNDYGKSDHEFASTMGWYGESQDLALEAGMTFINANQPLQNLMNDILKISKN